MAICQTATKTASSKDSTVVMSKKLVGYMIEDLIKSDADKQAIQIIEQNLVFKDKIIAQKDEMIMRHEVSMRAKNDLIVQYESNEKDMTIAMDKLKADLNKKKQANIIWKSAAAGLIVGLFVNHFSWKYGGKE